jgi:hypothetical protein
MPPEGAEKEPFVGGEHSGEDVVGGVFVAVFGVSAPFSFCKSACFSANASEM